MTEQQRWVSFAQASRELGHGRNYVSSWIRNHEKEFPKELVIGTGKSKLISDEGIEWIKEHTKKEGVLVSNQTTHEDFSLEVAFLGFTLSSYYFTILKGGLRETYQLA